MSSKWSLSTRYPSPIPHPCYMPPPLIRFDSITQIMFGEQCRSPSSSVCSHLQLSLTSSLLAPDILLSTLFSTILSLCSSLNVPDQVSHPDTPAGTVSHRRCRYIKQCKAHALRTQHCLHTNCSVCLALPCVKLHYCHNTFQYCSLSTSPPHAETCCKYRTVLGVCVI